MISKLFFNKNEQNSGGFTFTKLKKKFEQDNYIFTSGFVRDFSWDILGRGVANEINQKERESEMVEMDKKK